MTPGARQLNLKSRASDHQLVACLFHRSGDVSGLGHCDVVDFSHGVADLHAGSLGRAPRLHGPNHKRPSMTVPLQYHPESERVCGG